MAYQTLKLLKPWKPALKAQLKDKHGFFLSPANELKELGQYATQVFAAHPSSPSRQDACRNWSRPSWLGI